MTRTQLIHANKRWHNCITANLWPYAMRMSNDIYNNSPLLKNEHKFSPIQLFAKTKVDINPKHFKPFGCPVYVLNSALQKGDPNHKWEQRSKVGIYLGPSPQHGRSIALVLDRKTGLVSPQFHIKYDPSFQTTKQDKFDSTWQIKAGFVTQRESINIQDRNKINNTMLLNK